MRRIRLFLLTLLGFVITVVPVSAESDSITQIIDANPDLTWLQYALDVAPDVREQLDDGNSYTLFAPTDLAFKNLASPLGIPIEELLSNPDVATAILQYHIVEDSLSPEQIAERSGEVIPTLLPGAFISFRLNDDDSIAINNIVQLESSIEASNGQVHIINDVLRNRVIDNLLDASLEEFLANSNATSTATPEATETVTETPLEVSNIRVAQFASGLAPINLYLNEKPVFEKLAYDTMSDFHSLVSDNYELTVSLSDSQSGDTLLEPITLDMADGDFVTLVLTGSSENDTLKLTVLAEDYSALQSDSRILIYNALEDAPDLDIALGDNLFIGSLGQNDSNVQNLDAGTYDISVYAAGDSENPIFEQSDIELEADSYSFIALVGTSDDISLEISSLDTDTLDVLRQGVGLGDGQATEITETPEPPVTDTVLDILLSDDRYSLFVEALDAANPTILNRLASRNLTSITVLAPSNQAFENLFFTVPRSRVLGNRNLLTQVLQYHIVEGKMLATDFEAAAGTSVITLLQPTQAFFVSLDSNGEVLLNRFVQFEDVDIQASNGVIHVIDDVLLPQVALDAWGLD